MPLSQVSDKANKACTKVNAQHSPTLGAHAHAHACPYPWFLGGHGCDVIGHGLAWVGMGAILLFMGGHGWALVLCIPASSSKSESNFSDAWNMLTKKRSGLKPRQ